MNTQQLAKDVSVINQQMSELNKDLVTLVEKGQTERAKELREQVSQIKRSLREIRRNKIDPRTISEPTNPDNKSDLSLTHLWGDPRHNPYWLKLAEYFGVNEKEYPIASSKLNTILDWAANKSKSRKMADILNTVGGTLRKLPSAGYGERTYAILYRYIKLDEERASAAPQLKQEIAKEMKAYER